MINVVERVNTWVMPEDEEPPILEIKYIEAKLNNDDEEDAILGDIAWLFGEDDTVENTLCCTSEEGTEDAVAVVPVPSESLGPAEQGPVLQQTGEKVYAQQGMTDVIPSGGIEDERNSSILDWTNEPETTTAGSHTPRGRTRRFFAATWRGAKRLLLCGCFRRM